MPVIVSTTPSCVPSSIQDAPLLDVQLDEGVQVGADRVAHLPRIEPDRASSPGRSRCPSSSRSASSSAGSIMPSMPRVPQKVAAKRLPSSSHSATISSDRRGRPARAASASSAASADSTPSAPSNFPPSLTVSKWEPVRIVRVLVVPRQPPEQVADRVATNREAGRRHPGRELVRAPGSRPGCRRGGSDRRPAARRWRPASRRSAPSSARRRRDHRCCHRCRG